MTAVTAAGCVRCGAALGSSQEYCLQCGLRRPGAGRFGAAPLDGRPLAPRLAALGAVALAGAVLAIVATREPDRPTSVEPAIGGSVIVDVPTPQPPKAPAAWPLDEDGWTVVLVSVPKVQGRKAAVDVAGAARARGLQTIGVIDSSRYASLHPGYWLVWSGRYDSEAEATGALLRARVFTKSARVQRISR